MQFAMIWAIARAEMRSTRRLARYWVFSILSTFLGFMIYLYYAFIHAFFSYMTASIGPVGPRFLVSAMGMFGLLMFLVGLVFLAFDVRARDVRERMVEVLDSRAVTNLEFVIGRGVGLALMALMPLLVLGIILQSFGTAALVFDWPIGEPVEPYSLMGLIFVAITVFLVWSAFIVLLAVLVSNRLLVAVLGLAFVGLQMFAVFQAPMYLQPVVGIFTAFTPASDLLPSLGLPEAIAQKLILLVLAAGLFVLAAALHPRPDGWRKTGMKTGAGLVAATSLLFVGLFYYAQSAVDQRNAWAQAHAARSGDPFVDVLHTSGSVAIDPGSELALDIELRVRAPSGEGLGTLLFTLNPGIEVAQVSVDGMASQWTHESGLLEIAHTLGGGEEARVDLVAAGKPDVAFGYLDSAINFLQGNTTDSQIALLGSEALIFDSRYVALMPGGHWLPAAGAAIPSDDARSHPVDYFTLDLEVTIPAGWTVAGPGVRESVEGSTYRFRPSNPLPEVGLFAADFTARSTTVAGIEFEVLLHETHLRNLDYFADIGEELADYLGDKIADARRYGLDYPYGALTLVETPASLRGYGGGWRMDTTQALPGVLLMKESSFPTARFDLEFDDTEQLESGDVSVEASKVKAIEGFFANDISGGNILLGGSRNFVLFQTSAGGPGALALNYVLDELVLRLLDEQSSFFSPFVFGQQAGFVIGETVVKMVSGQAESVAQSVQDSVTNRPSVWDLALGTALADLDTDADPRQALNVLSLKSSAIAASIVDSLGKDKTAQLLHTLLERHRGGHFTAQDFDAAAADAGVDLDAIIGDWLHDSALPGFLTSSVTTRRLRDDDFGNPQYQTTFHVRNDEETPGLVVFSFKAASQKNKRKDIAPRVDRSPTYRLRGKESLEIGLVTDQPIIELAMNPYLALNRRSVKLQLPKVNSEERTDAEPFLGARPSHWLPGQTEDIVVDDLDDGFSVTGVMPLPTGGAPFIAAPPDLDQGLPQTNFMFGAPPVWSRQEGETSWGKYRHTSAVVRAGDGQEQAHFKAGIPRPGKWRLAYHLPEAAGNFQAGAGPVQALGVGPSRGSYDLSIVDRGETRKIEFDAGAAQSGWNTLGDFELGKGEVVLRVTNATSGAVVVADAIRWSPTGG